MISQRYQKEPRCEPNTTWLKQATEHTENAEGAEVASESEDDSDDNADMETRKRNRGRKLP